VEFGEAERVPVHAIEMTRRISPLSDLRALWRLWRILRLIRPQVVHAHFLKSGLLAMLASWLARAPVRVYHLRCLVFESSSGLRRRLLLWVDRVACALAHRVISVSPSVRAVAVAEGLCSPAKIRVLAGGSGNGVDAESRFTPIGEPGRREVRARYGIPADALVIGYVGRLVREKGIVELATAWTLLRDLDPRLRLLLVGRLEAEREESTLPPQVVASLRSDHRVLFTGVVKDTRPLYGAMDVVALPTYREGLPNVALEAAAMALPIVATRVTGCVDAVREGISGTLVEAGDAAALRDALERYLADPALRVRHGEAGRRLVLASFRREAIWEAIADEYHSLLASRRDHERRLPFARP
jgi:glycosyltransferase involved in cell wall biosynthesis